MKASVITIGDEIIQGQIKDENAAWIADKLMETGIPCAFFLTVPDDKTAIIDALRLGGERAEEIIVTGGLGPTEDDLTREGFAEFAGVRLVLHRESLQRIEAMFRAMGREMARNNEKQALIPEGAELIPNLLGTAPGFAMRKGKSFYTFLPGVPRECRAMMEESVLPRLRSQVKDRVFRTLLFRTFGMSESMLDQKLKGAPLPPSVRLGFRAVFPEIHLKLIAQGRSEEEAEEVLREAAARVRERVGEVIYSEDGRSLEEVVLELLRNRGLKLAVAESCTGGLVSKRLTDIPGSSEAFERGFVVYSNQAKAELLGVDPELIKKHGAVSEPVARAMAEAALARSPADLAIAITGIAGPSGGTPEKPVGTVFIAVADKESGFALRFNFARWGRSAVRELSAQAALELLRRRVLGLPLDAFK